MITAYDHESNRWLAAGYGPLRPIVCEGITSFEAVAGYERAVAMQIVEEGRMARQYAEEEATTAAAVESEGPYDQDGDMG